MVRRIAILGSTGSIGKKALRVIEALNSSLVALHRTPNGGGSSLEKEKTKYEIVALSAHSNVELLGEQARRYKPKFVAITNADYAGLLQELIGGLDVEILAGPDSLTEIAQLDEVDIVLTAVVGAAGLPAVLAAAQKGKTLAIANKEPLVIAGELLTATAKENNPNVQVLVEMEESGSPLEIVGTSYESVPARERV